MCEHFFPNHHNGKGEGQVLMVSVVGRDEGVIMQPKGEPDPDKMAQRVQSLFK